MEELWQLCYPMHYTDWAVSATCRNFAGVIPTDRIVQADSVYEGGSLYAVDM